MEVETTAGGAVVVVVVAHQAVAEATTQATSVAERKWTAQRIPRGTSLAGCCAWASRR